MSATRRELRQRGVVLIVSLLVLLVLGVIATTLARSNQLQLHMAGNDEARIAAMQQALAVVDSLIPAITDGRSPGPLGYRVCAPLSADDSCDERTLVLEPSVEPAAGNLDVSVVRVAPLAGRLPIMGEAAVSSTVFYRVAKLELQVSYDGTQEGLGRAVLAQGVLVRLPAALRSDGETP